MPKGQPSYLSIGANQTTAFVQKLRHFIISIELPQASLKVQVTVETKSLLSTELGRVLVSEGVSDDVGVLGLLGDETIVGGDFVVVEKVGASVDSDTVAILAEGKLKVGELTGGDDGKHTI